MNYDTLRTQILERNPRDRGFCGPLAIAAVTGLHAGDVAEYVKDKREKKRGGMTGSAVLSTVQRLTGHAPTLVEDSRVKTPISAARNLPKGTYLCFTRNHAFAVVDGKVVDWAEDRQFRITHIFKVHGV